MRRSAGGMVIARFDDHATGRSRAVPPTDPIRADRSHRMTLSSPQETASRINEVPPIAGQGRPLSLRARAGGDQDEPAHAYGPAERQDECDPPAHRDARSEEHTSE